MPEIPRIPQDSTESECVTIPAIHRLGQACDLSVWRHGIGPARRQTVHCSLNTSRLFKPMCGLKTTSNGSTIKWGKF